jgi:hypothetical protein
MYMGTGLRMMHDDGFGVLERTWELISRFVEQDGGCYSGWSPGIEVDRFLGPDSQWKG